MSVFRRRRDEGSATPTPDAQSATVPAARDPDLGVPPFRSAVPRDLSAMNLPPKPSSAMPAPTPSSAPAGIPPRPGAQAGSGMAGGPTSQGTSMPRAGTADRRTLVVGKGISLQGTVSDAERLVVEGTVESQMIQATELHISHSGVFKGEVQVEDAEIAGVFDGTLTARGSLVIRATGKVLGVARCRRLSVEEGGQVSGRMEMLTDAPAAAPAAPAAPQPSLATAEA